MPHPAPAHKSFADRNSLYQNITDKIVAELEQGRVPWVQPWGNVAAPLGLPKNATTGRAYTGVNVLILWIACMERGFGTQSWLTFRQALKAGGHVRKGEKGTTIVYADRFIPYRERMRAAETGDTPDAIPFLKSFTVFNSDQCEGLPADVAPRPPSLAQHDDLVLPEAEALIRATGADLRVPRCPNLQRSPLQKNSLTGARGDLQQHRPSFYRSTSGFLKLQRGLQTNGISRCATIALAFSKLSNDLALFSLTAHRRRSQHAYSENGM